MKSNAIVTLAFFHIKYIQMTFIWFDLQQIRSLDIILEGSDIVKALTEYVSYAAIEKLVLGAPSRSGFMRYWLDKKST